MKSPKTSIQAKKKLLQILSPGSGSDPFDWQAIVIDAIRPNTKGRVKFHGTSWPALGEQGIAIAPGTNVYVVDRKNLTLIVKPI